MNTHLFRRWWIMLIVGMWLLAACGTSDPLNGSAWQLVAINDTPVPSDVVATITFADGQIGGNTGCNSYGGTYRVAGFGLTLSDINMTMMACVGAADDVERAYTAALGQVNAFTLTRDSAGDDQLQLEEARSGIRLVFDRVQAAP